MIRGSGPASFSPKSAAGRESFPVAPSKKSSANCFGRRPSSNQRRATPCEPAIAPDSLSEGLHETPPFPRERVHRRDSGSLTGMSFFFHSFTRGVAPCFILCGLSARFRRAAFKKKSLTAFKENYTPSKKIPRIVPRPEALRITGLQFPSANRNKAESLADYSTGQRPVFRKANSDMAVSLSETRALSPRPPRLRVKFPPRRSRESPFPKIPFSSLPKPLSRKKSVPIRSIRLIRVNSPKKSSSEIFAGFASLRA